MAYLYVYVAIWVAVKYEDPLLIFKYITTRSTLGVNMQDSLFSQGIDLMMFGMGTVCVFLAVLVVVTTVMSKIVVRYFPEPAEENGRTAPVVVNTTSATVDNKTLTIIRAAIQQHRQK